MTNGNGSILGHHPDAELIFAVVCPLGTDHRKMVESLAQYLRNHFGYATNIVRLSDRFPALSHALGLPSNPPLDTDQCSVAKNKISVGNQIRERSGRKDFLALVAAGDIAQKRFDSFENAGVSDNDQVAEAWKQKPLPKTAHIIATLKRPEEVATLRRIYGGGFFLIGFAPSKADREEFFKARNITEDQAAALVEQDGAEAGEWGQLTRETFHLSDVFISTADSGHQIKRFLNLLFGSPKETPTPEEHAMFMAFSAALRSGDLSRQVGAALVDRYGDFLAVGFNEVPKFGGGAYGPEPDSQRDIERGEDSNDIARRRIMDKVLEVLGSTSLDSDEARRRLKSTGLGDLTEYGRSVHAEMQALFTCTRTGRSTRDATLYTTTFPCHNCCRHIIAAGVQRVVYVEPYPKSQASVLHSDAISVDGPAEGKIPFEPFMGIGPRRFFDLFSLTLSTGYTIERKENGRLKDWKEMEAPPRLQLQPTSYLANEALALVTLKKIESDKNV